MATTDPWAGARRQALRLERLTDPLTSFLLDCIAEDEALALRARDNAGSFGVPDHVLRFSPARVLAECEAKRKMLDYAFTFAGEVDGEWGDGHSIEEIRAGRCEDRGNAAANTVLSILALPYADRPGFRDEWRWA